MVSSSNIALQLVCPSPSISVGWFLTIEEEIRYLTSNPERNHKKVGTQIPAGVERAVGKWGGNFHPSATNLQIAKMSHFHLCLQIKWLMGRRLWSPPSTTIIKYHKDSQPRVKHVGQQVFEDSEPGGYLTYKFTKVNFGEFTGAKFHLFSFFCFWIVPE